MKKMMSASIALFVMEEPQVGPTVVMLILSVPVLGTELAGAVLVVVVGSAAAPALAVVVVAGAEVLVVGGAVVGVVVELGAWAVVRARSAFCTFLFTAFCWAGESLLRSDWMLSVCLLPVPSSCTVGLMI